jgi:hypothetical protein
MPLAGLTLLAGLWPAVVLAAADPAVHHLIGFYHAFSPIGAGR